MIDLRFIERSIALEHQGHSMPTAPGFTVAHIRKVKILQWRQCDNPLEVINGLQDAIWTDWTDIRTEEEHLSNSDDRD